MVLIDQPDGQTLQALEVEMVVGGDRQAAFLRQSGGHLVDMLIQVSGQLLAPQRPRQIGQGGALLVGQTVQHGQAQVIRSVESWGITADDLL